MINEAVTDYLGHPCRFTEAKRRFSDSYEQAHTKELPEIRRKVGKLLLVLHDRICYGSNATRAICGLVESIGDAEEPHALLEMLADYELKTDNVFWDFAGLVLAGFESVQGDQAKHVEPTCMQGRA